MIDFETKEMKARKAWILTLPDSFPALNIEIDKNYQMVTDTYGNHLFPLPNPVEDIETWLISAIKNFSNRGE